MRKKNYGIKTYQNRELYLRYRLELGILKSTLLINFTIIVKKKFYEVLIRNVYI